VTIGAWLWHAPEAKRQAHLSFTLVNQFGYLLIEIEMIRVLVELFELVRVLRIVLVVPQMNLKVFEK
jgi:hypothetical protein